MKIYHNPRCSKSRQTLKILETENIKFQIINYIKTGLTIKEIYEIISKLKVDPINIVRTQEKVWKTEYNKNMKEKDIINSLIKHPILLERPIVLTEKKGIIGRPPENVKHLIN